MRGNCSKQGLLWVLSTTVSLAITILSSGQNHFEMCLGLSCICQTVPRTLKCIWPLSLKTRCSLIPTQLFRRSHISFGPDIVYQTGWRRTAISNWFNRPFQSVLQDSKRGASFRFFPTRGCFVMSRGATFYLLTLTLMHCIIRRKWWVCFLPLYHCAIGDR